MLLRLSYLAILIVVACATETKSTDKLKESKKKDDVKGRNKRALYYQNDLISNQDRQMRKLNPFGLMPFDYQMGVPPLYDYGLYDYLPVNPALVSPVAYPLYGPAIGPQYDQLVAARPISRANAAAVRTAINPALAAPVDYNYDYPIPVTRSANVGRRRRIIPLSATNEENPEVVGGQITEKVHTLSAPRFEVPAGSTFESQFAVPQMPVTNNFDGQTFDFKNFENQQQPPTEFFNPEQPQEFAQLHRHNLDAIKSAFEKGNEMNMIPKNNF